MMSTRGGQLAEGFNQQPLEENLATSPAGSGLAVYLGNGAERHRFRKWWHFPRGIHKENSGSGTGVYLTAQSVIGDGSKQRILDCFILPGAEFRGYYARRKFEQTWHFYVEGGEWAPVSPEMPAKVLIQPSTPLSVLFTTDDQRNVFLESQWVDPEGRSLNTGSLMFSNRLMAHSLGGLRGKTYHNTRMAFDSALSQGHTYFEVDLSFTSDKRLVATHGWSQAACKHTGIDYEPAFEEITYDHAMMLRTHGEAVMDARGLYQLLKAHPAATFEVDFHKVEGSKIKEMIRALISDFNNDKAALDRLLIQAYSEQMHRDIDSVYRFQHYQYLVGGQMQRLDSIITYCLDNGICALALRWNEARPDVVRKIRNANLFVLCYTVQSDVVLAHTLHCFGVDTVCTDFITPLALEALEQRPKHNAYYVYYNAGNIDANEDYSRLGWSPKDVVKVPSGTFELKIRRQLSDGSNAPLLQNRFSVPGKKFIGWKMRVRLEGKVFWYCRDHVFRTAAQLQGNNGRAGLYIFHDEEILPPLDVSAGAKHVMVALWE